MNREGGLLASRGASLAHLDLRAECYGFEPRVHEADYIGRGGSRGLFNELYNTLRTPRCSTVDIWPGSNCSRPSPSPLSLLLTPRYIVDMFTALRPSSRLLASHARTPSISFPDRSKCQSTTGSSRPASPALTLPSHPLSPYSPATPPSRTAPLRT